ncbi:MAG: hypothetical protein FWH43_03285 [Endomicrobia bacterium]|nr:hypothetical protein [Endomicrobiia bacterium]
MKKLFLLLFIFLPLFAGACSSDKINEQKARYMLENAIFSPEQAYLKYKNFYMKTERIIDGTSMTDKYVREFNQESYNANSVFENKVVMELYVQDNKFRLSCSVESLTFPIVLHLIYDGETLWSISNFAAKDSWKMTFEQAKDYIGFPGPDFFKRIRSDYEQSGKEIVYKYAGMQQYNEYNCYAIEMELKDTGDSKAVFFIDKKTNIVVKTDWPGVFNNIGYVKRVNGIEGKKVPVLIEVLYGECFTEMLKYFVKIDEYIHPDIFNEADILLPLRSEYKEIRFQNEKPERRRARIRTVLDSVQSFEFVLCNMHLTEYEYEMSMLHDGGDDSAAEIELPYLDKENRLIPDDYKDYRIPIASEETPKSEVKKNLPAKPAVKQVKKKNSAPQTGTVKVSDENDETDLLEYSPRDAYQSIESELEDMKESDPEDYIKMKRVLEEMKAKDENLKKMEN